MLYTTLVSGADRILVPNGTLIQCAVIPLREPERVEFRARFHAETSSREVEEMVENAITVPLRYPPHIAVEELDRDDVVVGIVSTPANLRDSAKLGTSALRRPHRRRRRHGGARGWPEPRGRPPPRRR